MIRKITLMCGFAAGYVLGAKAGTQRYAQIQGQARALLQQTTGRTGPGAASSSAQDAVVTGASGRPGGTVGRETSSVAPSSPTPAQPSTKAIEEMTELELELATAPLLPGGTAGGPESGAAGAAGTGVAEPRSTTARSGRTGR